ncbi:hypothetical protein BC936DRAFT_143132 [Jimgerdemannia flammicorona]|uniref:GIY-YIG domain-containing protein n=1 Tax=Jimgerdemannia flammicorona TaxID=994334 RepID=A0A432ZZT9_9FUNG|nr:hypothetical protein BC936DRAFT_143132 [Jimgerdemannia flammicorona]
MIRNGLSKAAGVYGFQLISTGEIVYVGSSVNLARRFMDHVNNRKSNIPLQHGFAKYGVPAYNFLIFERHNYDYDISTQDNKTLLLAMEQKFLDLFTPRYNINPTAGSSLGVLRSQTFKDKQRANNTGQGNPMYGRAGEDSPRFGILHNEEARVKMGSQYLYVFDATTKQLISSYLGLREACREMSMSHHTIRKHIASGRAYKGMIFSYSPGPGGPG